MPRNKLKRFANNVVNYFAHPALRADSDKYHRARILIATMATFPVVGGMAFLLLLPTHFMLNSLLIAAGIVFPASLWLIFALFHLRRTGNYAFASISTVVTVHLIIVVGICVSGGPAVSPVVQLLVIPPLTAYFFGSLRGGGYAVIMSFLTLLGFLLLNVAGLPFIQTVASEKETILHFLVGFVNLSAISAMAFIYEFTAAVLKQERDSEHEKYILLAKTDPLTGLANRRNFDAMLSERMNMYGAQNPPRRFALGYLDLDGFKPINDQYGHAVGDEVLRIISDRLRSVLRGSDFVGRHGGDEFMLMLDTVSDQAALQPMADRLLTSIAMPIQTSAGIVRVTGSLGFAMFPLDAHEIEALKKSADSAMYEAKRLRDTWRLFRSASETRGA